MTVTRTRPRSAEAPPTEHVEGEPTGDALIDCDHVEGNESLIRSMGEDFPGWWGCSRCGAPFVSGRIVPAAIDVVRVYGRFVRGQPIAREVMSAVDRLALMIPPPRSTVASIPEPEAEAHGSR